VIYANGGVARITVGWRLGRRLEALFRAEQFDVVHVHGGLAPTLGVWAPYAAWRAGIPVVATFHTWFPRSIGYRLLRRPFQRMLDRHAAAIAVSRAAQEAMSRYFHAPWEIVPNGVDTRFFRPNGARPRIDHRGCSGSVASSRATISGPCSPRCRAFWTVIPARSSPWWATVRGAAGWNVPRAL